MLCAAQDKPQVKVDVSIAGRGDAETLEPGYTVWRPAQGGATDELTVGTLKFRFSVPEGETGHTCRTGWNKTFVQNAEAKAQNGRLTGDGLSLDPTTGCGALTLTISGLPKGTHRLQTCHNRWTNPATTCGWPINVKVNGVLVHAKAEPSFQEPVAANACILTTTLKVETDGAPQTITFYTLEADAPADAGTKQYAEKAPVINSFELNTIGLNAQARNPDPHNGDLHIDADDGTYRLSWSAANRPIVKHILYFGKDSVSVSRMTTPLAELTDTAYALKDLYSMDTYFWRVDEVDGAGQVTPGQVWHFRPRQLAFPGAEGYGRYATGGRGGTVYHVTNLSNDMAPGSFIYGLKGLRGPRTIVFDVSGLIVMSDDHLQDIPSVFTNPYLTIAAQTAPGKGICLKYSNMGIGEESIVRFLRAKRGYGATGNAIGFGTNHTILDHCTAAWGTDETVSARGARMITFQYSMIAEALGIADHKNYPAGTNHGYAATIDGKIGTYSHNLLANCAGRNWSLGGGMDGTNTAVGQMDIFNNVCYNWNRRTTDGGCHQLNFVGNYYKMGPDTRKTILFSQDYENIGSPQSRWQAYVAGNIRENRDHTLTTDKLNDTYQYTLSNGAVDPNTRTDGYGYQTFVTSPFFPSYATIHTARQAFKIVTSDAGATMPCRDNQHVRIVGETLHGNYTYVGSRSGIKGEIDREWDITAESATQGFEDWPEEHRGADFDTDQDGIPNWYERLIGSDEHRASNNEDPDRDGWTLLEDYLEFMAHPYLLIAPGQSATYQLTECFRGFTKSPVYKITSDSRLFSASLTDATVTVTAAGSEGLGRITLEVTDADGDSFSQTLGIAVSGQASGIRTVSAKPEGQVVSRTFFAPDGRQVGTLKSKEPYIMQVMTAKGEVHTAKVLAD